MFYHGIERILKKHISILSALSSTYFDFNHDQWCKVACVEPIRRNCVFCQQCLTCNSYSRFRDGTNTTVRTQKCVRSVDWIENK